jgi:hypothetical protein
MKFKPPFYEPIRVKFTDLEIMELSSTSEKLRTYLIKRLERAIRSEMIRPWLEVKGSDTE